MMLRDLSKVVDGKLDSSDPRVGVTASEIPEGFDREAFLLNDVDPEYPDRLYSMEILTPPEQGSLYLDKAGVGYFTGAPEGIYSGTQRVEKFDPGIGIVSRSVGTFMLQVGPAVPVVTAVEVTPANATGSRQFAARVLGENNPSQAVTWSANGGTITTGGLFTAPAQTLQEQRISVVATSVQDPTKSGTAIVTIAALAPPGTIDFVLVSPTNAVIAGGQAQLYTAQVIGSNSPPQGVTWAASLGQITAQGVLVAPPATTSEQVGTVTATSESDPTKSGTASFTVPAKPDAPGNGTRLVSINLGEVRGPAGNLSNLMVSFHAASGPHATGAAIYQSSTETTDAIGRLSFEVDSNLIAPGGVGLLAVLAPDGRHFLGLVAVQ